MALLDDVKLAIGRTTDTFDNRIQSLINAAKKDLGIAGVLIPEEIDDIVKEAIITYVHLHFGEIADKDWERLKVSYDEQKAQLSMATGYTNWGEVNEDS